jgi:hypothetical protein
MGRYEAEMAAKLTPTKTQSFLDKVRGSSSIESDVNSLQEKKT